MRIVVPSTAYDVVEDGNACSFLTEPVQDNHLALDDGIVCVLRMMLVLVASVIMAAHNAI